MQPVNVKELSADELDEWMSGGGQPWLVDVRTPAEFARGVISGAENLPLHLLPLRMDEVARTNSKVVFYCRSGARSAQACMYMGMHGHEKVYNLRGGIISWVRSGLQVVTPESSRQ